MKTPFKSVGVIGAGTMGGGIAMAFANAGFPVQLVDTNPDALERGIQRIRSLYDEGVKRAKVDADSAGQRMGLIVPTTKLASVSECDIVIEAVFEDLSLKSRIAAELGQLCAPHTVLASNTSSLDINVLAKASGRPERYIGMHFFSPAHIMRLVEVVRGNDSSRATIDAVVAMVRDLSKIPVVCGVCFGFIGNRMAEPYLREADALMLEGVTPERIDAVAQSPEWLGMAMGPCRMMDLAGLDIGASIIAERAAQSGLLRSDPTYRCIVRALAAQGQLGQKTGQGIYKYEGRQPAESPDTMRLARELARLHGVRQRQDISDEEIFQRLLFSLINEGFEVLREDIAETSADIDTVFTAGFGFPTARGGPMAMAQTIGLGKIAQVIGVFARERGNEQGYWTPSPLLVEQSQNEGAVR